MPFEDLLPLLRSKRIKAGNCTTPQSLGDNVASYQRIIEKLMDDMATQIINIINTGGGGTTPVYVVRALVNQVGGVTATTTTFAFDGATDVFYSVSPSGVTSGTAHNIQRRPFQDNEVVILTSFNGTTWMADKISETLLEASVNQSGGVLTTDGTFAFDNAIVRVGSVIPPGGIGTAVNIPATAYADDEKVLLIQADDGTWRVLQDDDDLGGGGGGGGETIQVAVGTLAEDVTITEADVNMNVLGYTGTNPGTPITVTNPPDALLGGSNKVFVGNTGGYCMAINFNTGWQLVACRTPTRRPT